MYLPSKEFAYLLLYHRLRDAIRQGAYPYGSRLSAKRALAEQSGVSVITVEHAYAILCEEGYVEARPRSGYFVLYRPEEYWQAAPAEEELSPLPAPRPLLQDAFPFSVLAKAMRRVLSTMGEQLLQKSPNWGCPVLRSAIAAYLARSRSIFVRAAQIVIGSGAEYLYSLIAQLLSRERIYGLENPSYEKIRRVYEALGVTCDLLKLGGDGIRSTELARTHASVLHVTPFRSFPSGVTASASKRWQYLHWAEAREGFLIEDDFSSEFSLSSKSEDTLFSLAQQQRVIYLNTFSKTIAPSLRIGYMVLPENLLLPFQQRLGFYSCTVPTFEQYVLADLLNSGDFERHINRIRRKKRQQKEE